MAAMKETPKTRTIIAVGCGHGGDGDAHPADSGHHKAACKCGLHSQADIEMCAHITKTYYPHEKYACMSATEKQKVWQLKHASKTGQTQTNLTLTKCSSTRTSQVSAVSLISLTRNSADEDLFSNSSGSNHSNKALACQTSKCQAMGD